MAITPSVTTAPPSLKLMPKKCSHGVAAVDVGLADGLVAGIDEVRSPCMMFQVPSVTMNGGSLIRATRKPLSTAAEPADSEAGSDRQIGAGMP